MNGALYLNFHGIGEPGRPYEAGEAPYWLSFDRFREILDLVEETGGKSVGFTFDDSNQSDFTLAMPELQRRGRSAQIFVLAAKVDLPGYLKRAEIATLSESGFNIGSHGLHHRDWTMLDEQELREETATSRSILEDIVGTPVTTAGIPFGRYNRRVLRALRSAGYGAIYSSDGAPRWSSGSPVPRMTIRQDTPLSALRGVLVKNASPLQCAKQEARVLLKSLQ